MLSVAKLHLTQCELVEDMGLVDRLQEMLLDTNATVLVNVLAALMDMGKLQLTQFPVITNLLTAISESHEWGQVGTLDLFTFLWERSQIEETYNGGCKHKALSNDLFKKE